MKGYFLLKRLSKSNRLVHIPDPATETLIVDKPTPANILDLAGLVIMKLVFGWDITMRKYQGRRFPYIPDINGEFHP